MNSKVMKGYRKRKAAILLSCQKSYCACEYVTIILKTNTFFRNVKNNVVFANTRLLWNIVRSSQIHKYIYWK